MSNNVNIIIRKKKRKKSEGGHGGAWKVAYADMVTILMMFFMVLWLVGSMKQNQRTEMVQRLTGVVLEKGNINKMNTSSSQSVIDLGGREGMRKAVSLPSTVINQAGNTIDNSILEKNTKKHDKKRNGYASFDELKLLAKKIKDMAQSLHKQNNLKVKIVPQGIRIVINDNKDQAMFKSGKSQMKPYFEDLLMNLSPMLASINNEVVISGHTDAFPYINRQGYSNWELSSERALQARKALQAGGMKGSQFFEVIGMGDKIPVRKGEIFNKENRRIEILVLTPKAEEQMVDRFTKTFVKESKDDALKNR